MAGEARPPPVRIDDFADPQFSSDVRELFSMMATMADGVRLQPDALCDAATAESGLSDFGDDRFREPLGVLCAALRTEAGLGKVGTFMAQQQLLGLLKNRLLLAGLLGRHPEIRDVVIDRPVVIAGLPRTGTTHLHNLMSADPALRSMPYWESLEPVLAESEQPAPGEPDPRRARTEQGLALIDAAMPHFKRMHEMTVDHVHEEIQLLAIDFSTMLFETMALMPSWRDWYQSHDQTPAYEYMKTVLQAMQWLRGGDRWVLKSPQHLEQFGPLVTTFPDATFVVTHRDPVAVTTSLVTMMSYSSRLNVERPDPVRIGRYWATRVEEMLNACVRDRELLPADRSIDVRFDEFMADDVAMVARIYAVAGQPMTDISRKAMDEFMADHPRGRHGTVVYDLAQFGLDAKERRQALSGYADRFGV